ncbi:DNA polymerase III subunit gamma/tau [Luteimonas abyssi]|uniref:DNA polymerase III subunit gamma/tau n=1 Tax=Luteimonas abyssi TaxID=1247514 RepID=UPI000737D2E0|nr:DNA polymerase III subunit gamma/tau [Luteimonas abyssi]
MSYLVLARKWRPKRFAELVGQEHVVRALTNALSSGRVHHAFLFTGTRGVGKTTIARIFAKSLNCESGTSADPCGECETCRSIDAGRFIDLLEIDAASNTGVDDVRELIDNAQYMPSRGRVKVYLIDEVHMLSKSAFNALLKTLEEPPEHVKFLLATTDPQKLPVTVLSRCLQFNLKRLDLDQIEGQIGRILAAEAIAFEPGAVRQIARAADGSLRDGLSLLDQAIAYTGGQLEDAGVATMLGTVDRTRVGALLDALAAGDGERLLAEVATLAEFSPDWGAVLDALADALHRVQIRQLVPGAALEPEGLDLDALADALRPEVVQLWYQMALDGRREMPLAPAPRTGFEMSLLRMLAFRPLEGAPSGASASSAPAAVGAPTGPSGAARGVRAAPSARGLDAAAAARAALEADGALSAPSRRTPDAAPPPAASPRRREPPATPAGSIAPVVPAQARAVPTPMRDRDADHDAPPWSDDVARGHEARAPHPPPPVSPPPAQPRPVAEMSAPAPSAAGVPAIAAAPMPAPLPPAPPEVAATPAPSVASPMQAADVRTAIPQAAETPEVRLQADEWPDLVVRLSLRGPVRELAAHTAFVGYEGGVLRLALPASDDHLKTPLLVNQFADALAPHLGAPPSIRFESAAAGGQTLHARNAHARDARQQDAERAFLEDPDVQRLMTQHGARLVPDSIRPVDDR